jgi:hypothetical protein
MDPRTGAEVFLGVLGALCMPVLCRSGNNEESAVDTEAVEEHFYHGIDIFFTGILS